MKKTIYLLLTFTLLFGVFSCSDDMLETAPTDRVSKDVLFQTVEGAQVAMDGVYRMLYTSGWTPSNTHQNFGIQSTTLYTSLMGEDMVQAAQGNGWFYFDYRFDVRSRYTSSGWRPYATWTFYYEIISNVNNVISAEETLVGGDQAVVDNIIGQAYAMRAYAYFMLIQSFQQTYIGHESSPGVPIYTEPTTADTEGAGRGTVQDVYDLINSDLDTAIEKLSGNKSLQEHKSHVDYYIANAFKANVMLVQNKWGDAATYAAEALTKPGLTMAAAADIHNGFNDVGMRGVMWGAEIIADQSSIYASFFSHMDARADRYARSAQKCIYNWLYDRIPDGDARKAWWVDPDNANSTPTGKAYNQVKFRYSDLAADLGDYIFMRAEHMQIALAEAQCRNNQLTEAKSTIRELMVRRWATAEVDDYLDGLVMSNNYTLGSIGSVTTLLDAIILQRRIELWGETERIFDILRFKTGFDRNAPESNHSQKLAHINTLQPDNKEFILTIPQLEFDSNPAMDASKDQNPM